MIRIRRSYRTAAMIASLVAGLCLSLIIVGAGHTAQPFRIGLTLGLTGKYAKLGAMQQRAYVLWQYRVNERGGLLGRAVKLIIFDDESNPKIAQKLYRKLIAEKHVDLVFGPYSSGITLAVVPIVEKAGYPMLAPGASSDKIWQQGYKNVFGVYAPASRYTVGMLNLAVINDLNTIAIVYANDGFSISAANGAKKWAPKLGLQVVMFERFEKGRMDLSALAKKAKLADASLVIVAGHFNESVNMRKALDKIGWYPKAYFATVGPVLQKYDDTLGVAANLTFASSLWEPDLNFPQSKEFTATFRARYSMTPTYHAATAYAAGQILEKAVKKANSLERAKIRQALHNLDTYTVIGRYRVDPTGKQIKLFPLTIQWQERTKRIVWPEQLAKTKPILKQ